MEKIPEIIFEVTKAAVCEQFKSFRELSDWANDCKDVHDQLKEEYSDFDDTEKRKCSFSNYVDDRCIDALAENGYVVKRLPIYDQNQHI